MVGSPKIVKGDFNASSNNLASLQGSPETIEGEFIITGNPKIM